MTTKKLNNHIERRAVREREKFYRKKRNIIVKNINHYNTHDVGGDVVKDDETYLLKDNRTLKNLVLSSTMLYKGKSTRGHRHAGQEEVYFFVQGAGKMIVGEETDTPFKVGAGDIVLIPDGAFHRVINDGDLNLVFNCVFDGKRNH
jgi:oxalate decarboxylase/phosphoglucose isomerase-like protein (cupin superfamily)